MPFWGARTPQVGTSVSVLFCFFSKAENEYFSSFGWEELRSFWGAKTPKLGQVPLFCFAYFQKRKINTYLSSFGWEELRSLSLSLRFPRPRAYLTKAINIGFAVRQASDLAAVARLLSSDGALLAPICHAPEDQPEDVKPGTCAAAFRVFRKEGADHTGGSNLHGSTKKSVRIQMDSQQKCF